MEGEIFNPIHTEIPPEHQNAAATAGHYAQPTPESAKPTLADG